MLCFLCDEAFDINSLKKHFFDVHKVPFEKGEARGCFLCRECNLTLTSFKSFKRHHKKKHPQASVVTGIENSVIENPENSPIENLENSGIEINNSNFQNKLSTEIPIQFIIDNFFSDLRCISNLPEKTVIRIWEKFSYIIEKLSIHFTQKVQLCIEKNEIYQSKDFTLELNEIFNVLPILKSSKTFAKQVNSVKKNWNYVSGTEIFLGTRSGNITKGPRTTKTLIRETFQYLSIKDTLSNLLRNSSFRNHLYEKKQIKNGNILSSYLDGEEFKKNSFLQCYPDALRINLYSDDLELVNALGSRSTFYKITAFYYTIQNIHNKFNSSIDNIFLLAIAYTEDVKKYGYNKILEPFVKEMNLLETDEGVVVNLVGDSESVTFRACLVSCLGDNLALNDILGFTSPSSNIFCRQCMVDRKIFKKDCFAFAPERSIEDHENHLECIYKKPKLIKQFGVKENTILNNLRQFHCAQSYTFDPAHDLLEGIVPMELKLVLNFLIIEKKIFSLELLNERINLFNYGFIENKNKPSPNFTELMLKSKGNKLKQKAVQSWLLLRSLPFMFHDKVPLIYNDYIIILIYLVRISEIVFSNEVTQFMVCELNDLIISHHKLFKVLFPTKNMINKHHYLLHYPKNIKNRGPIALTSCLRFESKHSPLKQQIITGKNFKNVPKSIIKKQALKQNCYIRSAVFETFTVTNKISKFCHGSKLLSQEFVFAKCNELKLKPYASIIKSISLNNVDYRQNFVIVVDDRYSQKESCFPCFVQINEIFELNGVIYFNCSFLEIVKYEENLNAFVVEQSEKHNLIISSDEVKDPHPNILWSAIGKPEKYIAIKYRY